MDEKKAIANTMLMHHEAQNEAFNYIIELVDKLGEAAVAAGTSAAIIGSNEGVEYFIRDAKRIALLKTFVQRIKNESDQDWSSI